MLFIISIFDTKLLEKLKSYKNEDYIDVLIVLKDQKLLNESSNYLNNVNFLKSYHFNNQVSLLDYLKTLDILQFKQFWVINAMWVRIKVKDLWKLENRKEIEKI